MKEKKIKKHTWQADAEKLRQDFRHDSIDDTEWEGKSDSELERLIKEMPELKIAARNLEKMGRSEIIAILKSNRLLDG